MKRPRQLRAWLETLLQSATDAHLLLTREGRVQYANPAALITFAADDGAMGDTEIERWIPDCKLEASGSVPETEAWGVSAGGDRFPLEYATYPADPESGRTWLIARDTQQKKGLEGSIRLHAEELERTVRARTRELEESRGRFAKFSEVAPVLDFELDSQGSIASANRKACLTLGVTADRLVGLSLAELAVSEKKAELQADLDRIGQGSVSPFETRLRGAQGAGIDVSFHPCRTELAGRVQTRLVGLDVSGRREAERLVDQSMELAEAQRARMERILRGIGEAVVVTDPDGQARLLNEIAARLLGVDETLAFGRNLFSEQLDTVFADRWREFLAGDDEIARAELRRDDPEPRSFEVTMSRVRTAEGRVAGYVCILRDVTRERTTARAKQGFVASLTHELRTPLASIRTLANTILQSGRVANDEDRRFLGVIDQDATRLQKRLEDLLTLTRLDAGRETLQYRLANIVRIMNEERARFTPGAEQFGLAIEVEAEGEGEGVFDADKVRRVIDRLLANSLRFSPRGGRITMSMRRVDDRLECAVQDEGKGMDADQLRRVLDPFSAVSIPGMPGVAGLGLHIAQRLVELHGGEMSAESSPGQGTTFRFVIPAAPKGSPAPDRARPREPSSADVLQDDPDPARGAEA